MVVECFGGFAVWRCEDDKDALSSNLVFSVKFEVSGLGEGTLSPLTLASVAILSCVDDDDFRSLTPFRPSFSLTRFLFFAFTDHRDSVVGLPGFPSSNSCSSPACSSKALSASSCWRLKRSSCSVVSFLTAASFARVDSSTESRNSISSSSRLRNWFLSLMDSSKASCLAARANPYHLTCQ